MKTFYTLLIGFVFCSIAGAQNTVNSDCINAIPLCTTPSFTFYQGSGVGTTTDVPTASTLIPNPISNPTINPASSNAGCLLAGELNPQWLLLTVGNAGMLEFVFGASNSLHPQVGLYDWAMWPYSPTACANIQNITLPPIRCNWNGSGSNGTGIASSANMPPGASPSNFEPPLAVNACQQFIICISNYSGVDTEVSFQSLGTASLSCNPNCNPMYAVCAGLSATIVPVNFAALSNPTFSIQPGGFTNTTGSFVVTPLVNSTYTTFITGTASGTLGIQTITATSNVTIFPVPVVSPTIIQTTCTNTLNTVDLHLSFNPSGTPPGYSISWSPIPNGIFSTTQTTLNAGVVPGVYNAIITTTNGCSTSTSFTILPQPEPAIINLSPIGSSHTITCYQPTIEITSLVATNNYTWSNGIIAPRTGTVSAFTSTAVGNWTISALNPASGCVSSQVFVIGQNVSAPSSVLSPTFQNITCNITSITTVTGSATPSVNVTHQIMAPQGGTFTVNSHLFSYFPGGIGTFTHCVVNDANGCSTCKTFTVTSNFGFPTYNVLSPENFTLGCGTRSVATLNIVNASATPSGAAVSYTIIGPPTSVNTPTGALSTISNYTVNVPGTWTVITKDNTSFCETRTPISILQNTFAPSISAIVPRQILDCNVPKTTLKAQSLNSNVNYLWNLPTNPGTQLGDTLAVSVNSAAINNSVVANYTLVITDNSSTCKSTSVITIYQNIYPPKAAISNGGTSSITCLTSTITLTNNSKTGIPTNTLFPSPLPVIGYIWEGPTPQAQGQVSSTYLAGTVGEYTMTAKDLNNGCTSYAYTTITDNRIYPSVNKPEAPPAFILDCGAKSVKISPKIDNLSPGFAYSWEAVAGATISGQNTATLTTNLIGRYRVLTINTINGCATAAEVKVTNGKLIADFSVVPEHGFAPLPVKFYNNSASTLGPADIKAVWSFGNGTHSTTTISNLSPEMVYTQPGTYSVTLFVNKGSCMDTLVKVIRVDIPSVLEIPNVFTPNGDGVNDLFFLKTANIENLSIMIFDRWGHTVYSLKSEKGLIEWDGKNQAGIESAEGTYFYTLKATGKDGQAYDKKGTITLIR